MTAPDTDFDDLFRRLFPHARTIAQRLVRDGAIAEELAAEAFTRAYARWPLLRRHPNPEAWILRVTSNLAIDQLRRTPQKQRQPALLGGDSSANIDTRLGIADALRTLPRRQREVIVLRYLGDLSDSDVAETLNIAEGTVKAHSSRGLAKLRELLGPNASEAFLHG